MEVGLSFTRIICCAIKKQKTKENFQIWLYAQTTKKYWQMS